MILGRTLTHYFLAVVITAGVVFGMHVTNGGVIPVALLAAWLVPNDVTLRA